MLNIYSITYVLQGYFSDGEAYREEFDEHNEALEALNTIYKLYDEETEAKQIEVETVQLLIENYKLF